MKSLSHIMKSKENNFIGPEARTEVLTTPYKNNLLSNLYSPRDLEGRSFFKEEILSNESTPFCMQLNFRHGQPFFILKIIIIDKKNQCKDLDRDSSIGSFIETDEVKEQ